jgi:serine/threonine-protein kinase
MREARVAASVHHPNIVDVYDAGEHDGELYLVMRYVDGTDLRTVLRGGTALDPARAVSIASQVGEALDAAHAAGMIHRDVTPSNILLSGEHAALTDFGLVKHLDTASETRSGAWLGTLAFVAPEALRDDAVDGRADVYALGCVLHRMLTGRVPFERESDAATIAAHLHDAPPPASRTQGVPEGFDAVIARALSKDPAARHPSAGALARDARAALEGSALDPQTIMAPSPAIPAAPAGGSAGRGDEGPTALAADRTRVQRAREPRASATTAEPPAAARHAPRRRRALVAALALAALAGGVAIGVAAERALDDEPGARARPSVPRTPATVALEPYSTPGYEAQIPRGWTRLIDDADRGGFSESRWRAPAPYRALLAIAYRRGSGATPEGIAEAARGRIAAAPTYSELAFGEIELDGDVAWRWVYGIDGQARATWYMNPCGTSVAVYGATKPSELLRWAPTFRAVTASIRPRCS